MPLRTDDTGRQRCERGGMPRPRHLLTTALALSTIVALAGCTASALPAGPGGGSSDAAQQGAPTGDGELTDDDGYIPDGSSLPLDSSEPAITRLDPALLAALRDAQEAAAERDTAITIADGWRSERYQERLFADAVARYGSEEEASRWVKRGADSAHVSGHAVDIATADAMDFLNRFGAEWGLCQAYANEMWHFERLTEPGGSCPQPAPDGRG